MKYKKVKMLIMIFILLAGVGWYNALPANTQFSLNAKAAVLMDPYTGKVLYAQNAEDRLPPASVTKLMTMLLILEAVQSGRVKWDDSIVTSVSAAAMGGSQVYLDEGEQLSLRDMFKAIAVVSANDASTAVAEYLCGSDHDFVVAMNRKAQGLGLKNTHFANETGLPDPEHFSSAHDLALIGRELLKYPEILNYTSIWLDSLRDGRYMLRNTNELIQVYRGADGLKTGYTDEAKFCLAATAKKGNFRLLAVVLGATDDGVRVSETKRLLDYGFRHYQWQPVSKIDRIERLNQTEAQKGFIPVRVKKDFGIVIERGRDFLVRSRLVAAKKLHFPIKAGEPVGKLEAVYNGKVLAMTTVYATQPIERAPLLVVGWRKFIDLIRAIFSFTVDEDIGSLAE